MTHAHQAKLKCYPKNENAILIVRNSRERIVFFMSIISEELYLFAEELQTVLSPTVLQELAKQVGFV